LASSCRTAGLIRSPGNYSPFKNQDRARARRNLVLTRLKENKKISDQEYAEAIAAELPIQPKNKTTGAPYFIEFVKAELKNNFSEDILTTEGLRIFTTLEMNHQRAAETAVKAWLDRLEKDFPKLKANAEKGLQLQGALVAVQPGTGFILAYVAGRDYGKVQFDHLRQAKRQPGSTFKPFVYLTALNRAASVAFTPASILKDDALSFDNGGTPWKPENYDHAYHGDVRLRTALEKSYNAATVWLGEQIGFDTVVETAEKAGITSELKAYPSLVLGAFEVTPMELAMAYSVFPGQGVKAEPIAIRRVVTPDGEILEKKSVGLKPVFDADVIYLMNRLLMGVVDNGTAASIRSRGFKTLAAGKTGTTSDARDSWFVGYTPEILALSWVGYDDNSQTGLSGASGALPIWTEFMKKAATGRKYEDFQPTSNIVIVTIDAETGLLWEPSCGAPISEYFIEGTEPFEYCSTVINDLYEYEDE
jgi:penicillin-binding protein 1B